MERDEAGARVARASRTVVGTAITVLMVATITIGIRAGYGLYADNYEVSGVFEVSGVNLKVGDDVKYRGVPVGEVSGLDLRPDHRVRIRMDIDDRYRVPADVSAVVGSQNLFGVRQIELEESRGSEPPYLAEGDEIAATAVAPELGRIVELAVPLVDRIDTTELATLMTELVEVADGEGQTFARNLETSLQLSRLLEDTIGEQTEGLDVLGQFTAEFGDIGPDVNASVDNLDRFLPTFNESRAAFERLLDNASVLADNLANLLVQVRPDLDVVLGTGANLNRLLLASEEGIAELIRGLDVLTSAFVDVFAPGQSLPGVPEENSRFAYLKLLVYAADINQLLCGVLFQGLTPDPGDLDTGPLLDILEQTPFIDCEEFASGRPGTVGGLEDTNGEPAPLVPSPQASGPAPQSMPAPPGSEAIVNDIYGRLAAPDRGASTDLLGLITPLLGGGR